MAGQERVWLRLQIPRELHGRIKSLGEKNGSGIVKQSIEQLSVSLDEPAIVEKLVEFFEPGATNIEVNRSKNLLSLAWTSDGNRRRIIYDSDTGEFLQNLQNPN
ncbi:hypothetical protein A3A74_08060 [Candidatus Roizmanbacteria bacterium RIFCSPLOWO2_01_FULL_35_13]|uniref:Uncharacterized protein n=1 Tax=Candidatus Roizmanbacteria bacterium RIFCSPLOWO2_01_FULL_35_13 TaxID=1802055 RepID=A0A1F7IDY7_9BACT|nr:MAG: hypothetical protein A3A74_08060 [Candidatus Roizmanbacteria bacterium RIFCSPLOWO2_01_FULL_35_13]